MIFDTRTPGFDHTKTRGWTFWCDGVQLRKVFFVDTDAGIAHCIAVDESGKLKRHAYKPEHETEFFTGHIEIKDADGRVIASTSKPRAPDFLALNRSLSGG